MTLKAVLLWLVGVHRPEIRPKAAAAALTRAKRPPLCPICKGRPLGPIRCDCGQCDFLLDRGCPFCGGTGLVPRRLLRDYRAAAASEPDFRLAKIAALVSRYRESAKSN